MGDKTVSRPDIGVNEHWESIGDNADGLEEHVQGVSVEKAALPTGAATETTLSAINTKLGEVQANPTPNTFLDRLKALLTGIVLAAGSNIIGRVGVDQTTPGTTDSVSVATAQGAGATIGTTAGAAVTTDANGTIQQYLRGLVKLLVNIISVKIDQTTPGTTNKVDIAIGNVSPQMDDTDKVAVSLYAGGSAAGDTGLTVVAGPSDNENAAVLRLRTVAALQIFNDTTMDRAKAISASGAGLGVLRVGTLGELITLAASAARTDSANGTAVTGLGWRNRYIILFDLTVADTDAGDTLDVYVDVSLDGTTWLNAVHFTQIIGTDAASKRFAVLDPSAPGTAEILVTSDAAAGVARPSLFGAQMRARWAIVDAGTDDASFTFSVSAFAI